MAQKKANMAFGRKSQEIAKLTAENDELRARLEIVERYEESAIDLHEETVNLMGDRITDPDVLERAASIVTQRRWEAAVQVATEDLTQAGETEAIAEKVLLILSDPETRKPIEDEVEIRIGSPESQARIEHEASVEALRQIEHERVEAYKERVQKIYRTLQGEEMVRALSIAELNHQFDLLRSADLSSETLKLRLLPGDTLHVDLDLGANRSVALTFEWTKLGDSEFGFRFLAQKGSPYKLFNENMGKTATSDLESPSRVYEFGTMTNKKVSSNVSPNDALVVWQNLGSARDKAPKSVRSANDPRRAQLATIRDIQFSMRDLPEPELPEAKK